MVEYSVRLSDTVPMPTLESSPTWAIIRRAPEGSFPRPPQVLPIVPGPGQSEAGAVLRARAVLRRLAPAERDRCRIVRFSRG